MSVRILTLLASALLIAPTCSIPQVMAADVAAPTQTEQQDQRADPQEYVLDTATFHMGTLVRAKVFGRTPEEAKRYAELVEAEVTRFDDMMSVHKDSPLNEVNRRSGEWVEVTPEIAEMSKQALQIADMTNSAFEPMIGPLVNLWKIGFGGNTVPDEKSIQQAIRLVDHKHVQIEQRDGKWFMKIGKGQNIDMGGIAKGYIGQKIAEKLKAAGAVHALLDLGGNIVAIGEKSAGISWRIGLQSPDKSRGEYFAVLSVKNTNVITSGAYERNFEKNGKQYGHILSPITGKPVKTDIASVTIVDVDGGKADALCTALFSMGSKKVIEFLKQRPSIQAVILLNDNKTLIVSSSLSGAIKPFYDELSLQWVSNYP